MKVVSSFIMLTMGYTLTSGNEVKNVPIFVTYRCP